MSIKKLQQLIALDSALDNQRVQALRNQSDMMDLNEKIRTASTRYELDELKKQNDLYKERQLRIDNITNFNMTSLDEGQKVALSSFRKNEELKQYASLINSADPSIVALTKGDEESGERQQTATLNYSISLLMDAGMTQDQAEKMKEMARNRVMAGNGVDSAVVSDYDVIPAIATSFINNFDKEFKPGDIYVEDDSSRIRRGAFSNAALEAFKSYENNDKMDFYQRAEASIADATAKIGIEVTPENAEMIYSFASDSLKRIADYRSSENLQNIGRIDGLSAVNMAAAMDGIIKIGSQDLMNMSSSAFVEKMNSDVGFMNMGAIASAVSYAGNETGIFANLNEYLKKNKYDMTNSSMSEDERRRIFNTNFIDVVASSAMDSNMPQSQKLGLLSILQNIDRKIESGVAVSPEVQSLLDQAFVRYQEGYSANSKISGEALSQARKSNMGVIKDLTGNQVFTREDFSTTFSRETDGIKKVNAAINAQKLSDLPLTGGYNLVKKVSDPGGSGVLNITSANAQFYLGSNVPNDPNLGLAMTADAVSRGADITDVSPVFRTKEGKSEADKIYHNMNAVYALSSVNGGSKLGNQVMAGLFMKGGKDNPIQKAGLNLKTFEDGYYLPKSVVDDLENSADFGDLKKAVLSSNNLNDALAGVFHMVQYRARAMGDVMLGSLQTSISSNFPDQAISDNGSVPILVGTYNKIQDIMPELFDADVDISAMDNNKLTRLYETLSNTVAGLESGVGKVEKDNESTIAMLDQSNYGSLLRQYKSGVKEIGSLADIVDEMRSMNNEWMQSSGSPYGTAIFRSTEDQKQNDLKNRLNVIKVQMLKALGR